MKGLNYIFLLFSFIFFSSGMNAQEWVEKMLDPNVNFYEVQKSFNKKFEGISYERGKGMKQYWRWENFMEPRVYPSGNRIHSAQAFLETVKFQRENKQRLKNSKSANWTAVGPISLMVSSASPGLGRVNEVVVDPNDSSVIYIGTPAGGLWKSSNFGQNWTAMTDDLPVLGVSGIAIDPNNSNIIYICTGDGDGSDTYSIGVFKSTDGGQTFDTTGFINTIYQQRTTNKLVIDPENSAKIYVAASDGLYLSEDSGASWTRKITSTTPIRDIEFQPGNSDRVYVSSDIFYVSNNAGSSFANVNTGLPSQFMVNRMEIAVTADDSNYVYAVFGSNNNSFYGLYRSTDAGNSFSLRSNTPNILGYNADGSGSGGQSWYDLAIAASPVNSELVVVGGINVWKSLNGGVSWNLSSFWVQPSSYGYTHADIHTLEYFGDVLYCGSDGGLYNSHNDGDNWFDKSIGLQISQFYKMAISEENPDRILTGAQDNGISYKSNTLWNYIHGGDGMDVAIDPYNPNIIYYESQWGGLHRSDNAGVSSVDISSGIRQQEIGAWVTPIALDPLEPSTIYAAYQNVWKSINRGETWQKISDLNSNATLRTLAIAPSDPNYIYICNLGPFIKRTTDGGKTWADISNNIANNAITDIEIHPQDPDIVWVSMSGYANSIKVFKTVDGGASWTNISNNLPNLPANTIVYDEYADGLYVGTDVGVYYTDSTMNTWVQYMNNLPNVIINELEIHRSSGKLFAATYGRGIWKSDLYVIPETVVPKFIQTDYSFCPGDQVQFRDRSFNNIISREWTFQGGNPSSSTAKNPKISYSSSGTFDVSLIVSDGITTDTLVSQNAVVINGPSNLKYPQAEGFQTNNFIQNQDEWIINNPNNSFNTWQQVEYDLADDEYAMYINNNTYDIRGQVHQLISPAYNISSYVNPVLEFDLAHKRYGSRYKDTLSILYSSKCGTNSALLTQWSDVDLATVSDTLTTFYLPVKTDFVTKQVPLGNVVGKESVRLIFDNKSGFGNNIFIDNIKISDIITGQEEIIYMSDYILSPNPFKDELSIQWERSDLLPVTIKIYSGQAKLIYEQSDISGSSHTINLANIPTGIYLLEINSQNHRSTHKIIKTQ